MTIQIELPPAVEAQLHEAAFRQGADPVAYLQKMVEQQLRLEALRALKHRTPPQSVADLKPRIPTPPNTTWLEAIRGQWPGDESNEEVDRALEEMS